MKCAIVFVCTAALVSALRLPLPRAADENNQVDKQPAQGELGDVTKSCEEQGGTQSTICSENQQYIGYNGMNGLIACCRPTPAPTQDQELPLESTSAPGEPGDKKESCEKQL
ncbi:hypothetical protein J3458_015222 [Metarhizium acridum]|uniref:uncharacterized protein n=1 Tax=Metarhizium acridum TaxID=92637 RepID=UPI001C6CBD51|nr:hypothetical protein J3458_015222 [Metarhizium acridum]